MPQELETDPLTGDIVWRRHALSISPTLATVLDKAIQPNARERYSTAKEMLDALNGMETVATSLPSATIVSSPPTSASGLNTQIIPPPNYPTQPPTIPSQNGEWKKAVIIGGLIGAAILLSTFLIREPLLNAIKQSPEESEKESPGVSQKQVTPTPSQIAQIPNSTETATPISTLIQSQTFPVQPFQPSPQPIDPATVNPVSSISTNATIVGDPGSKNIRSAPGTNYSVKHIAYPGDRVLVKTTSKDRGGYTWYNIYFPKSGAEGWIAGQLLAVDGQSYPQPSRPSARPSGTNATIVGEPGSKNIRSGPGTAYSARHIAYPGDRVQILASDYDRGGYLWYKVYFPKSGAQGWIAAQLINKD